MSAIGDSSVKDVPQVKDGQAISPFRSRSTVIFISCLLALLYLNLLCWIAGFFSEAIALISIYLVRDIMLGVMGHQSKSDKDKPALGVQP